MKKIFVFLIIIVITFAVFFMLTMFTNLLLFHFVNINKISYSSEENVIIKYSDIGFDKIQCECPDSNCSYKSSDLKIYHLENGVWKEILLNDISNKRCVNGTLVIYYNELPMCIESCTSLICYPKFLNMQYVYEWDMKTFTEEEGVCGNRTYNHYEKIDAQKGTYKTTYGNAEAVFEIK